VNILSNEKEGINLMNERLYMMEFQLSGMTCFRWFAPDGTLVVSGPEEANSAILKYLIKYGPECKRGKFNSFVSKIPPFGEENLIRKKHAMLEIFVEHEDDIKQGMRISSELVLKVVSMQTPFQKSVKQRRE
jgi:hypothetical protein